MTQITGTTAIAGRIEIEAEETHRKSLETPGRAPAEKSSSDALLERWNGACEKPFARRTVPAGTAGTDGSA